MRRLGTGLVLISLTGCADPTAIDVSVHSEVPCATNAGVSISLADTLADLDYVTWGDATTCTDDPAGGSVSRGHVVITPSGKSQRVVLAVTTRNDGQSVDTCRSDASACIRSLREAAFSPHETVSVRVDLHLACLGVVCQPGDTCVKSGECVPIADVQACGDACNGSPQYVAPAIGKLATFSGGATTCTTVGGLMRCWGSNLLNPPESIETPVAQGLSNVRQTFVGATDACAITGTTSTTISCFGMNAIGELGLGDTTMRATPTPLSLPSLSTLAMGQSLDFAITPSGVQYAGGSAAMGLAQSSTFAAFPASGQVVSASNGAAYACLVMSNGSLECSGDNSFGQLGVGDAFAHPGLQQVVIAPVESVAAGSDFACALLATSGAVVCWGRNDAGQLGNGRAESQLDAPSDLAIASGALMVAAGGDHACAIQNDGAVVCWGQDQDGALGDDAAGGQSRIPVAVKGLPNKAAALSVGSRHSCALLETGAVYCWGYNAQGQLGNGTGSSSSHAIAVANIP